MKSQRVFSLGLALLLLSGFFTGLAMAENDSLHVTMTVQDRHYSVGDTATIEVRVYDKGELADASNITLQVSQNPNLNNAMDINLTRQDTGVYQGQYTIKGNDNHHYLYFFYEAWLGNDHEVVEHHEDALVIDVYSVQDTVDVSFDGQEIVNARPGDIVTATILVRTGDTPIPVTGFDELYVEDQDGNRQNLSYRGEATGIYLADFTVPENVHSQVFEVYADPTDIWDQDSADINVNVLDVWYHRLIPGTTTTFELCVADPEGQPVEGASIWIQRDGWPHDVFTGTTNASGKGLFNVRDVNGNVGFSGYVMANGYNQTIDGTIINHVAEEPDHNDFDIVWDGTQTAFEVGRDVTIPYTAYDAAAPAGSRTVYYYVEARGTDFAMFSGNYGDHVDGAREVIASGSVVTNAATGSFNIEFKAPDEQCALEIRFEVPLSSGDFPGQEHDTDDDMFYLDWPGDYWNTRGFVFYAYDGHIDGDGGVGIGGGGFKAGGTGTVTVDMDAQSGDRTMAYWAIGETSLDNLENYDPDWMSWTPAGNTIMLHTNDDGKLEGDFHVATFLDGQDVSVIAGYVGADGIPHFDSKTISPGGVSYTTWLIIIIIIAVIAAIIIGFVKYKYF